MKLSLKLQGDHRNNQQQRLKSLNPLITAKIPVSILNHPFQTSVSASSLSSDLSLSLSTHFSSGPSLRLSYTPAPTDPNRSHPFSLCLKSGLGLFGSPNDSPLVFKAHFSFASQNPTFSLHFKPQVGNFALKKAIFSNPRGGLVRNSASSGSGSGSNVYSGNGVSAEGSSVWEELKLEPLGGGGGCGFKEDSERVVSGSKEAEKDGAFTGIAVMARTVFPMSKKFVVNMRWGVNLPSEFGAKFPYLSINKVGFERVEVGNEIKEERNQIGNGNVGDLELLKGMCFWMSRDLEVMERENQQMKRSLEEMTKLGVSGEKGWKNDKEENARREAKKPSNRVSDLESELQRAIKAKAVAGS